MGVAGDAVSIQTAMSGVSIAQPDVTLLLDLQGVIRNVTLSEGIGAEDVQAWLGRPWPETVGDANGVNVRQLVEDARTSGVSAFRQIAQRFPSGRELPMEYTAVRLGGDAGLLAIGKQRPGRGGAAVAPDRGPAGDGAGLLEAAGDRDPLPRAVRCVERGRAAGRCCKFAHRRGQPAAMRALGLAPAGRDLFADVALPDHEPLRNMLLRVREHGRAPGVLVHLGAELKPWLFRASLIMAEAGPVFLLQLAPVGASNLASSRGVAIPVESLMDRVPDGFVVTDPEGSILHANQAFLDLARSAPKGWWLASGCGAGSAAGGRSAGAAGQDPPARRGPAVHDHDLGRARHGRRGGDLGRDGRSRPSRNSWPCCCTTRPSGCPLRCVATDLISYSDRQTGRHRCGAWSGPVWTVMERRFIEEALDQTRGNRTAAAELFGLSRQSLYAKLGRYGLDGNVARPSAPTTDPA